RLLVEAKRTSGVGGDAMAKLVHAPGRNAGVGPPRRALMVALVEIGAAGDQRGHVDGTFAGIGVGRSIVFSTCAQAQRHEETERSRHHNISRSRPPPWTTTLSLRSTPLLMGR